MNRDPRVNPFGTHLVTYKWFDIMSPRHTACELSLRYDFIKFVAVNEK